MAISYVMMVVTSLNVTRWCQLIRKTIKLIALACFNALMVGQTNALALSLSHEKAIPSELIQYIVPRFSLKTRIRFDRVDAAGDIQFVTERPENGPQVLKLISGETVYIHAAGEAAQTPDYQAFVDWLVSEPGRATIADFQIDGRQIAIPTEVQEAAPIEIVIVGDRDHGRELSWSHCRRCHKVDRADKYAGIDNAPSFHAMRSFDDWYVRFSTFYTVSPHKALISVKGSGIEKDRELITIAPIDLQMSDINDIVAFVHSLTPLDLGKPIQFNP
jgi:hypothetical protein